MRNLTRTAIPLTKDTPNPAKVNAFVTDAWPRCHFLETDWRDFVDMNSGAENTHHMANVSFANSEMSLREHLALTPMGDFTNIKTLTDRLDARLMGTPKDRTKRKKTDTWDGADLEVDTIINRRGIPFSERRKVHKQKPVLIIAQRLANVITSGGDHKWNAAQGIWLAQHFTDKGFDIEFYAYSDHENRTDKPLPNRVMTSVKLKGRGERLYPEMLRRALCDGQVYRNSWWGYRGLTGVRWRVALGNYWHCNAVQMRGFTWADGNRIINLPLTLNEEACVNNIERVLNGDTDMCYDYRKEAKADA